MLRRNGEVEKRVYRRESYPLVYRAMVPVKFQSLASASSHKRGQGSAFSRMGRGRIR